MTTDDLTTARLDVPVVDVLADLDRIHANLVAGEVSPEMWVQVHEFLDIDPDIAHAVCPPIPNPRKAIDIDYVRSLRLRLVAPVDWVNDPPASTRRTAAPDCEPEFVDRTVANVQTGGRL